MTHKPQPWYASLNLPAWIPQHGRHRKPHPPTHHRPADRTSDSARADIPIDPISNDSADSIDYASWACRTFPLFESPPAPAIPYAGVRAGEIIGYRMWYVTQHHELCSLAHQFIWDPEAVIEGDINKIVMNLFPFGKRIYGGTYSYASIKSIALELQQVDAEWAFPAPVAFNDHNDVILALGIAVGTIKCWGEVVEHEKGYRAQYAKLQSIDMVVGEVDIDTLRRRYNV